ncbi:MAG: CotH kinase family protein, partial [Myxococcota bacterium]
DPAAADTGIFASLDLDGAVDWVIVNELMKNHDGYLLSVHLWKDEGGRAKFSPWDFDLSLGYPVGDCGAEGWVPRTYLDRIAGYDASLAPIIEENFERWPIEDIAFATDGVDNWLCPVASWQEEHDRVVQLLTDRLAWIDANIDAF